MLRSFTLAAFVLVAAPLVAADPPGKKVAIVVGIDEYKNAKLGNLRFAGRDANALGLELDTLGFTTRVLTTDLKETRQPTKANIEAALKDATAGLTKRDVLLVFFSGQGLELGEGEAYLCPSDAKLFKDEKDTLIAVADLLKTVERAGAGNSFVLLDACRNDPDPTRGNGRDALTATRGVAVLLACSSGEKCYEDDTLKHGVFTHAVLTGLRGDAKDRTGKVTWDSLAAYVRETVPVAVNKITNGNRSQRPQLIANLVGPPVVFVPAK